MPIQKPTRLQPAEMQLVDQGPDPGQEGRCGKVAVGRTMHAQNRRPRTVESIQASLCFFVLLGPLLGEQWRRALFRGEAWLL